ncbi:hypothetical protein D917_08839 [Trichinella nativa]|uniref:Uncharacterized protein n=1 Tax=Trichinella nativa TaxID=6335 RepID=A0A1Y3EML2_9BILA|nr:hypothetical protein D917_08839 [Trichinella nativa]
MKRLKYEVSKACQICLKFHTKIKNFLLNFLFSWYNAVKSVLIDFEDAFCCNESSVTDLSVTEFNRSKF